MTVSVVVPYRPGEPWRDRAWAWVAARYRQHFPDWELVTGVHPDGPFSRTQAILDGAAKATGDLLVIADADVWCEDIKASLSPACDFGWAVPHTLIHRLSPEGTEAVYRGGYWRVQPLSADNNQDQRPYKGNETGTLVVVRRDALEQAPPDPRFVGWGQEDQAWGLALRCIVGPPWRGDADLVHLWHPPQPRMNRIIGSPEGKALLARYRSARRRPDRMRALIEEGRRWHAPSSAGSSSTTPALPAS